MFFDFSVRPSLLWASISLVSLYVVRVIKRRATHKLPPGPMGLPLIGNLLSLSATPWKEFEVWKDQYGPLVYIEAPGQKILVLNTHKVASELLDHRGHIYSDRPRMIMAGEIYCGGLAFVFNKYTELTRKIRRACHEAMSKTRVVEYCPQQANSAVRLVDGILQHTEGWPYEFRRSAASTMLSVLYDLPPVSSIDDPTIVEINHFIDTTVEYARPGRYLVEFFPWLRYLPPSIAKWKRDAEDGFKHYSQRFQEMFHDVEKRINEGDDRPSFTGTLIRERARHGLSDLESSWLSATMYAAGSETSAATMNWFMLAMVSHPEKQKKCQEELDAVVGRARMPTLADQESLPYIRATAKESLRWRPPGPLGIQHCTAEDDWYQGYFIPKGTMCLPNVWTMNRDKSIYGDDAEEFNPDRFIDKNGRLSCSIPETKDGHVTFGFGHRTCVGRHMANNALFIDMASILWAFNISPVKDAAGNPIIPDSYESQNDGLVIRPVPFDCVITPRFPEARAIITQTRELIE